MTFQYKGVDGPVAENLTTRPELTPPPNEPAIWQIRRLLVVRDKFEIGGASSSCRAGASTWQGGSGNWTAEIIRPRGDLLVAELKITYCTGSRSEVWLPACRWHLDGAWELVRRTLRSQIPRSLVLPMMQFLYDHLADENLGILLEALIPDLPRSRLHDVYPAAQVPFNAPELS